MPATARAKSARPGADGEVERLQKSLLRRFRTVKTSLVIAGHSLEVLHPASADDLIDEDAFERDERLPYWADLWPSGRVLGESIAVEAGAGHRLIELGCGAGLVAICAALAGYDVTATDYYAEALEFTRVNVFRNTGLHVQTQILDWRDLPAGLACFDRVVGADLLYEMPYGPLVAHVIRATLAPHGTATIADPGRIAREGFLREATAVGLAFGPRVDVQYIEGAIRQTIALLNGKHSDR